MPIYCPIPSLNYLDNIANFILHLKGVNLEDIDILVPNAYAANALQEALLKHHKSKALILPKILPIQKIDVCCRSLMLVSGYEFVSEMQSRLFIANTINQFSNGKIELDEAILMSKSLLVLFYEFIKAAKDLADISDYFDAKFEHANFLRTFLSAIYNEWLEQIKLSNKYEPISYMCKQINLLKHSIASKKYNRCLISVGLVDEFLYVLFAEMVKASHIIILPPISSKEITSNKLIDHFTKKCLINKKDIIILGQGAKGARSKNLKYIETENLQEAFNIVITILASNRSEKSFTIVTKNLNLVQVLKTLFFQKACIKNYIGCALNDNLSLNFILLITKLFLKPVSIKDLLPILKHPYVSQDTYSFELFLAKNNLQLACLGDVINLIAKNFPNIYQIYTKLMPILNVSKCTMPANILLNYTLTAAQKIAPNILHFENNSSIKLYIQDLEESLQFLGNIDTDKYFSIINLLFSEKYSDSFDSEENLPNVIKIIAPKHILYTNFDYCIVPEFVSSLWPDNKNQETWLPTKVQKDFGLADIESKTLYLYQSYFEYLCCSEELFLIRPKKIGDSYTKIPYYISEVGYLQNLQKDLNHIQNFERKEVFFEFNNVFPNEISATQIDELINNPYAFYVKKILNINFVDFFKFEPTAADFGTFIHKTIDLYTKSTFKGVNTFISIARNLFIANKQDTNIWWTEKIEHIAHEFCLMENARHKSLEKAFSEEYGYMYVSLLCKKKIKIICKADKIEVFPNHVNIIDYKTGSIPTIKSIKEGRSMQLIVAALIATYGSFPAISKEFSKKPVNHITYIKLNNFAPYWQVVDIEIDQEFLHKQYRALKDLFISFTKKNAKYLYFDTLYSECKHLSRIFMQ